MRASILFGAAAMLAAFAPLAHAQTPAGDRLSLICQGTDAMLVSMNPYSLYNRGAFFGGQMFGEGRQPAQLGVLVENGQVRVRPPRSSEPLFAKEAKDGWYELADVSVDRLTITGRLKWNRIDRSKLIVDRRTGQATFGSFAGVCQIATSTPETTKF